MNILCSYDKNKTTNKQPNHKQHKIKHMTLNNQYSDHLSYARMDILCSYHTNKQTESRTNNQTINNTRPIIQHQTTNPTTTYAPHCDEARTRKRRKIEEQGPFTSPNDFYYSPSSQSPWNNTNNSKSLPQFFRQSHSPHAKAITFPYNAFLQFLWYHSYQAKFYSPENISQKCQSHSSFQMSLNPCTSPIFLEQPSLCSISFSFLRNFNFTPFLTKVSKLYNIM